MVRLVSGNTNESKPKLIRAMALELFKNYDSDKCQEILDISTLVATSIIGLLSLLSVVWPSVVIFVIGLIVFVALILFWCSIRYVIRSKKAQNNEELRLLKQKLEQTNKSLENKKTEYLNLESKYNYAQALWSETSLFASAVKSTQRDNNARKIYTKLANSISEMVINYSGLSKEQFSVHIYIYDGLSRYVKRVEVSTCITTIQPAEESKTTRIDDVLKYYYAQCIVNKAKTFSLDSNLAIREKFYFETEEDPIALHGSQYAAMSYTLGSKMELYVEVISYDEAKLGDNLQEFISKVISPFSAYVNMVDWRKIRSGLSEKEIL